MDHLRERVDALTLHVNELISQNRAEMTLLDKKRRRETRTLHEFVEQKATITQVNNLSEQVQSVNRAVATNAEYTKIDLPGQQMQTLSEHADITVDIDNRKNEMSSKLDTKLDNYAWKEANDTHVAPSRRCMTWLPPYGLMSKRAGIRLMKPW